MTSGHGKCPQTSNLVECCRGLKDSDPTLDAIVELALSHHSLDSLREHYPIREPSNHDDTFKPGSSYEVSFGLGLGI